MSSCADHLREATLRAAARLTVEERIVRALELGRCDLELYAAVSGQPIERASLAVRARRAAGRRAAQRLQAP